MWALIFPCLREFRARLLTNQAERRLFDVMLSQFRERDRKSTRLNSSHTVNTYAVFCLKKQTRPLSFIIYLPVVSCLVFLDCYREHRDLHSFPTRRSSDLELMGNMRLPLGNN